MISKKSGVVVSQIEERNRVEFEPLGATKPPLLQAHIHDCDKCDYLGSLEVDGRHHDFYACPDPESLGMRSYVARYGSIPSEYVSFADAALRHMGADPGSVEEVLRILCLFNDCEFKNSKHGFAVLLQNVEPNKIEILINPLLEERRQIYIQDAVQAVESGFLFVPIVRETLIAFVGSISALVQQQIEEGR